METKSGYKTTEFWATMLFHAAGVAGLILGFIEAEWALAASGIVQSIYNYSRGLAKHNIKPD